MGRPSPAHRASGIVAWGLLLIVAQLVLRGWALWGSWFYFDDLAFVSAGYERPPRPWDFVGRDYAGHLMPAGWLVIKALATWGAVRLGCLGCRAGRPCRPSASYGMLRLLRGMFGDHPMVLALLAGYLFYVFTVPAGLVVRGRHRPAAAKIALVFGLHAHLQYLRTRRVRHVMR